MVLLSKYRRRVGYERRYRKITLKSIPFFSFLLSSTRLLLYDTNIRVSSVTAQSTRTSRLFGELIKEVFMDFRENYTIVCIYAFIQAIQYIPIHKIILFLCSKQNQFSQLNTLLFFRITKSNICVTLQNPYDTCIYTQHVVASKFASNKEQYS